MPPAPASTSQQVFWLLILSMPIATVTRSIASEEILREPRDWLTRKGRAANRSLARKFFYMFTCEYCLSHWVTLLFLLLTRFKLLIDDWRGYVIAWFALVLVANLYLNLYSRLRVDITSEKKEIEAKAKQIEKIESEMEANAER
jgi:hypothetical protein